MNWRTSSYTHNGGNCVEVAETPDHVHIRDTRHRSHGHLSFPLDEWRALIAEVKAGRM